MANNYIVLKQSDGNRTKLFKVIASPNIRKLSKAQSVSTTIDGKIDVAMGSIQESYSMTIRAWHEAQDPYGTKDDLEAFYRLNNPNGSPSNVIELTDWSGNTFNIVFVGDFSESLLGTMIDGPDASSIVNCLFKVVP